MLSSPSKGSEVMLLSLEFGGCSSTDPVAAGELLVPVLIVTAATVLYEEGLCRMQDNTGKEKEGILDLGAGPDGRLLNPVSQQATRSKNSWKLQRLQMKTKESII